MVTVRTNPQLPGAAVTITSVETAVSQTRLTNSEGTYAFPSLAPGRFNIG